MVLFIFSRKLASLIGDDNFGKDLKCGAIIDCYTNLFLYVFYCFLCFLKL